MSERKFDGRRIARIVKLLGVLSKLADAMGIDDDGDEPAAAGIEQPPQPLAMRQLGPRRGRPPANVTYDTADVEAVRAFVGTVAGKGGTKAEMIDKIFGVFGALNPSTVQSEFAKVGISLALSLVKKQLGQWRKRRQERGE